MGCPIRRGRLERTAVAPRPPPAPSPSTTARRSSPCPCLGGRAEISGDRLRPPPLEARSGPLFPEHPHLRDGGSCHPRPLAALRDIYDRRTPTPFSAPVVFPSTSHPPTHRVPPGLRGPRRHPAPSRSRPPLHPEEDPLHRPLDRRLHGQPLLHHPRRGLRTDSARHDDQIQADRRGQGPRPVLHPGARSRVLLPRASGRPGGRSCRNAGGRRRGRTAKYIPMISWKKWSGRWFRLRARELRASRGPPRCRREKAPTGAESARGSGGPQEWRRVLRR